MKLKEVNTDSFISKVCIQISQSRSISVWQKLLDRVHFIKEQAILTGHCCPNKTKEVFISLINKSNWRNEHKGNYRVAYIILKCSCGATTRYYEVTKEEEHNNFSTSYANSDYPEYPLCGKSPDGDSLTYDKRKRFKVKHTEIKENAKSVYLSVIAGAYNYIPQMDNIKYTSERKVLTFNKNTHNMYLLIKGGGCKKVRSIRCVNGHMFASENIDYSVEFLFMGLSTAACKELLLTFAERCYTSLNLSKEYNSYVEKIPDDVPNSSICDIFNRLKYRAVANCVHFDSSRLLPLMPYRSKRKLTDTSLSRDKIFEMIFGRKEKILSKLVASCSGAAVVEMVTWCRYIKDINYVSRIMNIRKSTGMAIILEAEQIKGVIETLGSERKLVQLITRNEHSGHHVYLLADIHRMIKLIKHTSPDEMPSPSGIKDLEEYHNRLSYVTNKIKIKKIEFSYTEKEIEKLEKVIDGYVFRLPKSNHELMDIASQMGNICVGSYCTSVATKDCIIVVAYKQNKPTVCIELSSDNWRIFQAKLAYNNLPEGEDAIATIRWALSYGHRYKDLSKCDDLKHGLKKWVDEKMKGISYEKLEYVVDVNNVDELLAV